MIGTVISCGDRKMAFGITYNRLMNVRSYENRGYGVAGPQGVYHCIYLDDDPTGHQWIDDCYLANGNQVSIGPCCFADQT